MGHFKHRFGVKAPLEMVMEFHRDTRTLKLLTPPPAFIQLLAIEPLAENSISEFNLWLGPVRVHWVAVHQDVDPFRGFTDYQKAGPFSSWVHSHRFYPIDTDFTEIEDEIYAEPGVGVKNRAISKMMWMNLPLLFAYRSMVTRRTLENRA